MSQTHSRINDSRQFTVQGLTCSHCVRSVRGEVEQVHGVTGVEVDLASGTLNVTGSDISDDAVRAAVVEAGYSAA